MRKFCSRATISIPSRATGRFANCGGTIAKYVANRGIKVLDLGVPVLSMHSPFEVIHKTDLYMAYRTFALFNNAQQ